MKKLDNISLMGGDGLWCPPGPIFSFASLASFSLMGTASGQLANFPVIIISDQCSTVIIQP